LEKKEVNKMIGNNTRREGKLVIDRRIEECYDNGGIGSILAYVVPEIEEVIGNETMLTYGMCLRKNRMSINLVPQVPISLISCYEVLKEVTEKHPQWKGYIYVEERGKKPKTPIGWP